MHCCDMSQIEDLLKLIKRHRDAGVIGLLVVHTWIGWRIRSLQKCTHFGFKFLGLLDLSRFCAERIEKSEAMLRVSRVLMGAETIP
jgi:hypothetical protein